MDTQKFEGLMKRKSELEVTIKNLESYADDEKKKIKAKLKEVGFAKVKDIKDRLAELKTSVDNAVKDAEGLLNGDTKSDFEDFE